MAVYSFLEKFDWSKKTVYPFCTHEGSGLSGTEKRSRASVGEQRWKKALRFRAVVRTRGERLLKNGFHVCE